MSGANRDGTTTVEVIIHADESPMVHDEIQARGRGDGDESPTTAQENEPGEPTSAAEDEEGVDAVLDFFAANLRPTG